MVLWHLRRPQSMKSCALSPLSSTTGEKIEGLGRARINGYKVFEHLLHHPLTTIASISKAIGLSVPAVTTNVRNLEKIGVLRETTGQGKNRIYEYTACMQILAKDMDPIAQT